MANITTPASQLPLNTYPLQYQNTSSTGSGTSGIPEPVIYQQNIKNPRVQSAFLGLEHEITETTLIQVNGLYSHGHHLLITDIVNRNGSVPFTGSNILGLINPNLPNNIAYRSDQGTSDYSALTVKVQHRGTRTFLQAAYTWSHNIDIQTDPLAGEFNLEPTNPSLSNSEVGLASLSRQFDPQADRGNSDFDQRQNLVLLGIWDVPGPVGRSPVATLLKDWRVAGVMTIRSGFPYSVFANNNEFGTTTIENNRANVLNLSAYSADTPVPGGRLVLQSSDFAPAPPGELGDTGRNAFFGPGLVNMDLSLNRWVSLGEKRRLAVRADVFNFLNHANLHEPQDTLLGDTNFGVALYGRYGSQPGLPPTLPLADTSRQIQVLLRFEF